MENNNFSKENEELVARLKQLEDHLQKNSNLLNDKFE